jgi:hypothetical protein
MGLEELGTSLFEVAEESSTLSSIDSPLIELPLVALKTNPQVIQHVQNVKERYG